MRVLHLPTLPSTALLAYNARHVRRLSLPLIFALALAIRVYPLHIFYLHPDQELIPAMALRSFVQENWSPTWLYYPTGLMYTLRIVYHAAYAIGHALGQFRDRVDVLGAFTEDPFPFLLPARILASISGWLTVVLTYRLGAEAFGRRVGVLAALFLAFSFLHVRESHYGSLDAPATCFMVATLLAAERYRASGSLRALLLAGVSAGLAIAFRYQAAVAAFAVATAVLLRREGTMGRTILRLAGAGVVAVAMFIVLTPYAVLEPARLQQDLTRQMWASFYATHTGLPLLSMLALASGHLMLAAALAGVVAAAWRREPAAVLLLAVTLPYLAVLHHAERTYARYLLPVLPILALFAAYALARATLAWRLLRRPAAVATLAILVIADPAWRSVLLVRLLAREDTRIASARWIQEHIPDGEPIAAPIAQSYVLPILPVPPAYVALWYSVDAARTIYARRTPASPRLHGLLEYGERGEALGGIWQPGRYLLTFDHSRGWVAPLPPEVAAELALHARLLETFHGLDRHRLQDVVFDPLDANFVPLRGLEIVERPGPNITIWRLNDR